MSKTIWGKVQVHYIPSVTSTIAASLLFLSLISFGVAPKLFPGSKPSALRSLANSENFSASPNPIQACTGNLGTTVLAWNVPGQTIVRVRKDGPAGAIVASGGETGTQQIATANGDLYYLYGVTYIWRSVNRQWQRVETQLPLSQLTIAHTQDGCGAATVPSTSLNGAFMYAPTLPTTKVPEYIAELKNLNMDTVVVAHVRAKTGDCSTPNFSWGPEMPDKLGTILDAAQSKNIQVYVGLDFSMDACAQYYYSTNATQVINDTKTTISTLLERYGTKSALAGWYIPDEPDFVYMDFASGIPYYAGIVTAIRAQSDKPILIAPFFAGSSSVTPTQLAAKALDFKQRTGVTVEVWQDSIGADPKLNIGSSTGYTTQDYYTALIGSLGATSVWSDNELFNCCTTINFAGGSYKPASITRIAKQLELSKGVSKRLAWLPQYHMGSVDPNRYTEAERLLAAYKAWYHTSPDYEYIHPQSYTWTTKPSPNYSDSGTELTNGITAPTKDFFNSEWVGVEGNAELIMDLGMSKKVDWVAVHTMHFTAPSIFIPSEISVSCSADSTSWTTPVKTSRSVTGADSEYVLGNTKALNLTCRYLKIKLPNTGWTFLSEVEIVKGN